MTTGYPSLDAQIMENAKVRIAELEAELTALRPWAEKGKKAIGERWWWLRDPESQFVFCRNCDAPVFGPVGRPGHRDKWENMPHGPNCDVLDLEAKL